MPQHDNHIPFSFDALDLREGDDVLYSNDPSQSDFAYGKVIKVKGGQTQAIDVFVFGHGHIRTQCWHEDDPRILTHKNRFVHQCHGVFRLTDGEIIRKGLVRRMEELEQRLLTLDTAMCGQAAEAEAMPTVSNEDPVRRRGRPPKNTAE